MGSSDGEVFPDDDAGSSDGEIFPDDRAEATIAADASAVPGQRLQEPEKALLCMLFPVLEFPSTCVGRKRSWAGASRVD